MYIYNIYNGKASANMYVIGLGKWIPQRERRVFLALFHINAFAYFKWDEMKRRKSKVYEHLHM